MFANRSLAPRTVMFATAGPRCSPVGYSGSSVFPKSWIGYLDNARLVHQAADRSLGHDVQLAERRLNRHADVPPGQQGLQWPQFA